MSNTLSAFRRTYASKTGEYMYKEWLKLVKDNIKSMSTSKGKLPKIPKKYQAFDGENKHNDLLVAHHIKYGKSNDAVDVMCFHMSFDISTCKKNDPTMVSYDLNCTELSHKIVKSTEQDFIDKIIEILDFFKSKFKQVQIFTNHTNEYVVALGSCIVFLKFVSKANIHIDRQTLYHTLALDICYGSDIPDISKNKKWYMTYNSGSSGTAIPEQPSHYTYQQLKDTIILHGKSGKSGKSDSKGKKNTTLTKCDLIVQARKLGMKGYSAYNKDELARKISQYQK